LTNGSIQGAGRGRSRAVELSTATEVAGLGILARGLIILRHHERQLRRWITERETAIRACCTVSGDVVAIASHPSEQAARFTYEGTDE